MITNPALIIWDWSDTLVGQSSDGLTPLPYAQELLELFHKMGIPQAVVSNGRKSSILAVAERLGWADKLDLVVGIDCGLEGKPSPEMVLHALAHFHITKPESAILFGDTQADLDAGISAGCSTYCVSMGLDPVWKFYNKDAKI